MKRILRSFSPVSPTSSVSLSPLGSPAPTNKTLLGSECMLFKIVGLRTKGKYSVPVTITTTDAAAKVKESEKAKVEYQEIYFNIAEMDLIASEFKLHKEC